VDSPLVHGQRPRLPSALAYAWKKASLVGASWHFSSGSGEKSIDGINFIWLFHYLSFDRGIGSI
jgi:hypothetical protein